MAPKCWPCSNATRSTLILMDGEMPVLDGYETTRRIRRAEQGGPRHIPIVAISGNSSLDDQESARACGMDDPARPIARWRCGT